MDSPAPVEPMECDDPPKTAETEETQVLFQNKDFDKTDNDKDKAGEYDDSSCVIINPIIGEKQLVRNELVFTCKFHVPPIMQTYYYVPTRIQACSRETVEPVVFSSPEFQGGFRTKWRLLICLDRWEETTRFVSLFLSRIDIDKSAPPEVQLQCDFRIVDKDRNVLKSQKNVFAISKTGETRGFTKFLPFREAAKMITSDDFLHVEAHMTIIVFMNGNGASGDRGSKSSNEMSLLPKITLLDLGSALGQRPISLEKYNQDKLVYNATVDEEDKVEFIFDKECIGLASRTKLLEASGTYQKSVKNEDDKAKFWTRMEFAPNMHESVNRMTIHQFLQFLDSGISDICAHGSYEDIRLLYDFGCCMEYLGLLEECVRGMCQKCPWQNALVFILFLKDSLVPVDDEALQMFRKYCRQNWPKIKSTPAFREIFEENCKYFTEFLLSPFFKLSGAAVMNPVVEEVEEVQ